MLMPFNVLGLWLRALLSAALVGVGIYLLTLWNGNRLVPVVEGRWDVDATAPSVLPDRAEEPEPQVGEDEAETVVRYVPWEFGLNRPTAYLVGGLALLGWSLGGWFVPTFLLRRPGTALWAAASRSTQRLRRPDGTELHVETYGPADAPVVVMTHGWGLDAAEWCYAWKELAGRFRLITWDLPGLGRSTCPAGHTTSLEEMARDLDAVVSLAGGRPVVLLGHSIGGMITLTYCRLFPEALGTRVKGLVIAQSTYTNPVKTSSMSWLAPLQTPVLEPLCYLMIGLSPVFWLLNLLSYLNGSAHRSTERSSFSGQETRQQLDYLTRYLLQSSPAVVARGYLAMFRYDATDVLARIPVPALVVAGDRDSSCLPAASEFMARAIPGAKLVTLRNAEHCGLFEHHEAFHAAVEEFVPACLGEARAETRAPAAV